MASTLDPLKLLQEDSKDDDYEQCIAAIKRLTTVALALGPNRTRNELLPFLMEYSDQDNDEALTAIGQQLGDFVELVGGAQHAVVLLPLLEKLAGEEESVVRDAAGSSLQKLVVKMPKQEVGAKFVPVIRRLANGDWFTTRVSACGLFSCSYPLVTEQLQDELRSLFTNLCNDDTPMVRKAAFSHLGEFITIVQRQHFKTDMLPILKSLAQDDLDYMRIYTINCCKTLASTLEPQDFVAHVLPLVDGIQDDASWRVRKQLSEALPSLCEAVGEQTASKRLLPVFAKLLKDKEPEVRAAAALALGPLVGHIKTVEALMEHIAPCLEALTTDQVQLVRVAFSKTVVLLAPAFARQTSETSVKLIMPLIQQMAKDEHHEVRNNVIERLDALGDSLGANGLVNGLLPSLLELAKDPKWRVRMAVMEQSSLLARHLGVKNFEKRLQQIIVVALSDHVFAIREKACTQIGLIVEQFGGKWAAEKFFPTAFLIYDKTTNYLHRMTCLLLISNVTPACTGDIIEKHLLPLVTTSCTDDVPNVRIHACRTLSVMVPRLEKSVTKTKVLPLLQKMTKDADEDVAFFAAQTAALCEP